MKLLIKVMLDMMKEIIDQRLRDEHAGFWKDSSSNDQIVSLRIIVEQTMEWQTPLYVCLIDLEKAFDSNCRQSI
uniref:Reverse transcriptase domain-containing protein n=1 Tax=Arion vulgaris TaxID=1028688 RepID=A0A0B7B873_9EUPU